MTINAQQVQEQVEVVVEAKIMNRIDKLTATKESSIYTALAPLPKNIVARSLKNLGQTGQIRKVRTAYGHIYITRKETTNAQVAEAHKRTLSSLKVSSRTNFIQTINPYFEQADTHYSETSHFGDSSVEQYNAQQAEIAPRLNEELTQNMEVRTVRETRSIRQRIEVERKISYQDDIGQGERNTKRAQRRYAQAKRQELIQLLGRENYDALQKQEAKEQQLFTNIEMPESSPEFDDALCVG